MRLRVGSLFTGIGGFDVGFERAGHTVGFQCEIDPDARKVLTEHWPTVPCHEDVSLLTKESTGGTAVDVLVGGFPCQDLSVAGQRAGLAGERSGLFHEFMRVADELAPRWVVIENVPGLLSSNNGRDMGTVLGTLADLGYGWAYRVLDAQYFGVAQRRRRVFIVGCAGDSAGAAQVLFEPESCGGNPPPSRTAGQDVAGTLGGGSGRRGFCDDLDRSGAFVPEVAPALTRKMAKGTGGPAGDECQNLLAYRKSKRAATDQDDETWVEDDFANTLTPFDVGDIRTTHAIVARPMTVRRLLPVECERLQGFPDGWTASLSDSARYRTLGNAVAVPVAEWIGTQVAQHMARRVA